MKKWPIIVTIPVLLLLYGLFLLGWYTNRPEPPVPTTVPTTAAPTTGAVTEATSAPTTTAAPTTEPTTVPTTAAPLLPPDESVLKATTVFVYDMTDGRLIYSMGDLDRQIAPASLTKMITALIVLEHLDPEAVVEVTLEEGWVAPGSSVAAVYSGNRLTVEMLLQGLLMQSGNDAAYALAAAVGRAIGENETLGGPEALELFLQEMERKRQELGMLDSCFLNPDGFDKEGHYSTPRDLMTLAIEAAQQPLIRRYAAMHRDTVTYESGEQYVWLNTNQLLNPDSPYYCPQAFGLKTGTTDNAGCCLIAGFEQGGRELLIGVLGCPEHLDRFADAKYLFEHFISQ